MSTEGLRYDWTYADYARLPDDAPEPLALDLADLLRPV
jgi:hypothetical protein